MENTHSKFHFEQASTNTEKGNSKIYQKELLKDYREFILQTSNGNYNSKQYHCSTKNWKSEWNSAHNILAKTLIYELSPYSHVEAYDFVKEDAFKNYCIDYKNEYYTADIMNGWWYCFKQIFSIRTSRNHKNTRAVLEKILEICKEQCDDEVFKSLNIDTDEETFKIFLKYLKVVYTLGNLSPTPNNPGGRGFGELDLWEYKLHKYKKLYHDYDGDVNKLHFEDYSYLIELISNQKFSEYTVNDKFLYNHMNNRIELILKRGIRILHPRISDKHITSILTDLINQL